MMTDIEVSVLLDHMATAYRTTVTEQDLEVWCEQVKDFDSEQALIVADHIIATDEFFPKPAKFRALYRLLNPESPRDYKTTVDPNCRFCRGSGWGESAKYENNGHAYESVIPCSTCNPKGYERWRTTWAPDQAAREARRGASSEPELLRANPRQGIDWARSTLRKEHVDMGSVIKGTSDFDEEF